MKLSDVDVMISVGFLLLFLGAMDLLKITDPELKWACLGLIGTITGWKGVTSPNLPYNKP